MNEHVRASVREGRPFSTLAFEQQEIGLKKKKKDDEESENFQLQKQCKKIPGRKR